MDFSKMGFSTMSYVIPTALPILSTGGRVVHGCGGGKRDGVGGVERVGKEREEGLAVPVGRSMRFYYSGGYAVVARCDPEDVGLGCKYIQGLCHLHYGLSEWADPKGLQVAHLSASGDREPATEWALL